MNNNTKLDSVLSRAFEHYCLEDDEIERMLEIITKQSADLLQDSRQNVGKTPLKRIGAKFEDMAPLSISFPVAASLCLMIAIGSAAILASGNIDANSPVDYIDNVGSFVLERGNTAPKTEPKSSAPDNINKAEQSPESSAASNKYEEKIDAYTDHGTELVPNDASVSSEPSSAEAESGGASSCYINPMDYEWDIMSNDTTFSIHLSFPFEEANQLWLDTAAFYSYGTATVADDAKKTAPVVIYQSGSTPNEYGVYFSDIPHSPTYIVEVKRVDEAHLDEETKTEDIGGSSNESGENVGTVSNSPFQASDGNDELKPGDFVGL